MNSCGFDREDGENGNSVEFRKVKSHLASNTGTNTKIGGISECCIFRV